MEIIQALQKWIDSVSEEIQEKVRDFPDWEILNAPKRTQEWIVLYSQDRARITNLIVALHCQKRNIRKVMANQHQFDQNLKALLDDIAELLNIVYEKRGFIDSSITALRSIQTTMREEGGQNQNWKPGEKIEDYLDKKPKGVRGGKKSSVEFTKIPLTGGDE